MIDRLLVANRGEIARRVFATCRRLGIQTVAVHSDADASLSFVREADVAVRLPGNTPGETYLRGDLVLDAAIRAGADAIHPGYGFLSENAEFARAVTLAGLTWIGPAPESIEAMGSKVEAKKLMAAAGVPILEAPDGPTAADLPLLVKASAGGGGRGMRVVRSLDALPGELAAARAEAESAFGDGTVFVEPYLERGRHVEVQVVGTDAEVLVLGTRDCSLQRRHQKVVEEAPAPGLPDGVREAMHQAARKAAAAVGYVGAGTVEFLYDAGGEARFWFLEMNTRLQVEHPVTEAVYGVDLVELQIAVAEGRSSAELGAMVARPTLEPVGHAVEVRLYAEDPARGYQPHSGVLDAFELPHDFAFGPWTGYGVRLDAGFDTGEEVSTFYDAMLAKVIAWAPTREQALRRLGGVLRQARLHGVVTNREQLLALLEHPILRAGEMTTALLEEEDLGLAGSRVPGDATARAMALFAATMAVVEESARARRVQQRIPAGWRNVYSAAQLETFELDGVQVPVGWRRTRRTCELVDLSGEVDGVSAGAVEAIPGGWRVVVEHDGLAERHEVFVRGDRVDVETPSGHFALRRVPRFVDPAEQLAEGSLLAPMPGAVATVPVETGAIVTSGQTLLVLEAMKMQHAIKAPTDGVVAIEVSPGDQVAAGDVLAVVAAQDPTDEAGEDR